MREISSVCAVMALFRLNRYFVHQLCQLFFSRLLINVYETVIIHNTKPLRLQRYNKKMTYARKNAQNLAHFENL